MLVKLLWGLGAFVLGTVVAYFNFRLTCRQVKKSSEAKDILRVSLLRQGINIALLVLLFLLRKLFPVPFIYPILGAALGLTLSAQLFAIGLVRKEKRQHPRATEQVGQTVQIEQIEQTEETQV